MTLQEKKRAIIRKIEESTSDDFISKLYYDISRSETWDNTLEGKTIISKLLEKSQKEVQEGNIYSFEDVLNETKEKYGLK